jgi:pectin methylesterase-like acyl-CoA thioesterase
MKPLMTILALALTLGVLLTACSKARKVETNKLSQSFATASAEVKAEVDKALGALKTKDYLTALTALKKVTDTVKLTDAQKRAVTDSVTDIEVIVAENPPPGADKLFELLEGIRDKL